MGLKRLFGAILCLSAVATVLFDTNITGNIIGKSLLGSLNEILVVIMFILGIALLLTDDMKRH